MEAATIITVDTEVEPLAGISVAFRGMPEGFYFPIAHYGEGNITLQQKARLFRILASRVALVFHNAVYDLRILKDAGFDYKGKFYDTMLMAHWINEEMFDYSLDAVSKAYGGRPKEMPLMMKVIIENDGWAAVPASMMERYSGHDAVITDDLFYKLLEKFIAEGFDGKLWDYEQAFIRDVMYPMMELGIALDTKFIATEYMRGIGVMQACEKELGFKVSSPKALTAFLIDELELPVLNRTKTGRVSLTKKEMEVYDVMLSQRNDSRAETILRYRGWLKTTSSNYKPYMELADKYGVLHPGYKLHGTRTGRLSCEKPNLQQIPKSTDKEWNGGLKEAFVARPGYGLWTIDYSQLQFRMTVGYANETGLIEIFNDATRDIFTEMAKQMGWTRNNVKTLVYLILFGGGAKRAMDAFGLDSVTAGAILVNEFHARYPGIKRVSKEAERHARKTKAVTYWTGRRRHFPVRRRAEGDVTPYYRAFNAVIQGGEAEIIKRAMIEIKRTVCDENCRLVLQIHDEVVFEIKEGMEQHYLAKAQAVMESVPKQFCEFVGKDIAFRTSIGKWGEK